MTPQPVGAGGGWTSGWMTQQVDAAAVGQGGCQGGRVGQTGQELQRFGDCCWCDFRLPGLKLLSLGPPLGQCPPPGPPHCPPDACGLHPHCHTHRLQERKHKHNSLIND